MPLMWSLSRLNGDLVAFQKLRSKRLNLSLWTVHGNYTFQTKLRTFILTRYENVCGTIECMFWNEKDLGLNSTLNSPLSLQLWPVIKMLVVVQPLSCVWLFVTLWTAACQASLSFTISLSLLKLMSIESMMPSNHLILLPPSHPFLNLSQHQDLFQWVSSSHQVVKVLELQL